MIVRFGKDKDIPRIAEMIRGLYIHVENAKKKGSRNWSLEKIKSHVCRRMHIPERYFYLVADNGASLTGMIECEYKSKYRVYLMKGYVEPAHRRQGIMRQMEMELVRFLAEKGIREITLKVYSDNCEGVRTWTAIGYDIVKTIPLKIKSTHWMKKSI